MVIEEAIHEEPLPEVDKTIDIYSVISKFFNSIRYENPVVFPLPEAQFIELQTKLHELSTGTPFFYNPTIKEFDATFEGRMFTFIKYEPN